MHSRRIKIPFVSLLATAAILFVHPAFASGDVKGNFDGKVMCEAGIKKAEFKSPVTQSLSYSSAADIKHRIDALTWPSSEDTTSFTVREKEKTELKHALKMLQDYSCEDAADAAAAAAALPVEPERGTGPQLYPHRLQQ